MAKKPGIEILEEENVSVKSRKEKDNECPVCGNPGGRYECEKCGWGIKALGRDFSTGLKNPVSTIMHARMSYNDLKEQNKRLEERVESLMTNNGRFSELVQEMEKQIKELQKETGKKYIYRYEVGGWGDAGDVDRTRLILNKKKASPDEINLQLREILRLIEKYKK